MDDPHALNIYTDGSSLNSPRRGGIGVVFVYPDDFDVEDHIWEFEYAGYKSAANNEMELLACITALREVLEHIDFIREIPRIMIHTDSTYIANNYKKALKVWPNNNWMTLSGPPVKHVPLWKEFRSLFRKIRKRIDIEWVKGHSKNIYNRMADRLSRQSARNARNEPLRIVNVRRKNSLEMVERGSVKMRGQKMKIRIITDELLPQDIYEAKYEVMSEKSIFYNKIDIIYSKEILRSGHIYRVSVNRNDNYPMVSKIIEMIS